MTMVTNSAVLNQAAHCASSTCLQQWMAAGFMYAMRCSHACGLAWIHASFRARQNWTQWRGTDLQHGLLCCLQGWFDQLVPLTELCLVPDSYLLCNPAGCESVCKEFGTGITVGDAGWVQVPAEMVLAAKVHILDLDNTIKLQLFKPDSEAY